MDLRPIRLRPSMMANDIGFWIGTVAAVVAALYAVLAYHRSPQSTMDGEFGRPSRRFSIIACIFAVIACVGTGFDYYDRHFGIAAASVTALHVAVERDEAIIAFYKATSEPLNYELQGGKASSSAKNKAVVCRPTVKACDAARTLESVEKRLKDGTY